MHFEFDGYSNNTQIQVFFLQTPAFDVGRETLFSNVHCDLLLVNTDRETCEMFIKQ